MVRAFAEEVERSQGDDYKPVTFDDLAKLYLEDFKLQQYRSLNTAKPRVGHLRSFFEGWRAEAMPEGPWC